MVKSMKIAVLSTDHHPGSVVQGELIVEVQRAYKCRGIVVKLWGGAEVGWAEGGSFYNNLVVYVTAERVVWSPETPPPTATTSTTTATTTAATTTSTATTTTATTTTTANTTDQLLPQGRHCFPFSFKLPQDLPSSFESACGWVRYEVEARILHSSLVSSLLMPRRAVRADFEVMERISGVEMVRLHGEPVVASMTKKLFLKFGFISVLVNLPGSGFSPGETIPVSVHVSNQTARHLCVESSLLRKVEYTSGVGKTREVVTPVVTTVSSSVLPWLSKSRERQVKVPIDVQVTIRNCSIISVEYFVAIKVVVPWGTNMEFKIPVVVVESGDSIPSSQRHRKAMGAARGFYSIQWPH